jgi:hypothetical protein
VLAVHLCMPYAWPFLSHVATCMCAVTELKWDGPLSLKSVLRYPDPRLRAPNARIACFGDQLQKLADEMFNIMYKCALCTKGSARCKASAAAA